jgi:hypothetical protein
VYSDLKTTHTEKKEHRNNLTCSKQDCLQGFNDKEGGKTNKLTT